MGGKPSLHLSQTGAEGGEETADELASNGNNSNAPQEPQHVHDLNRIQSETPADAREPSGNRCKPAASKAGLM